MARPVRPGTGTTHRTSEASQPGMQNGTLFADPIRASSPKSTASTGRTEDCSRPTPIRQISLAMREPSTEDVRLRRSRSVVCCCRRRALRRRHLVPETNPADQKRAAERYRQVRSTSCRIHQARGIGFAPVDLLICYAVAPGLAATVSYQCLSARLSEGTGMLSARVAKSTVTKVVMSAAEKVSPAVKGTSASLASMSP